MKQLQNNFTTPEQSKWLLELGLPADSADMYYSKMSTETFWSLYTIGSGATYTSISTPPYDFMFVPCWSVGRLIEICNTCAGIEHIDFNTIAWLQAGWSESLVRVIRDLVKYNLMDFSKLEE